MLQPPSLETSKEPRFSHQAVNLQSCGPSLEGEWGSPEGERPRLYLIRGVRGVRGVRGNTLWHSGRFAREVCTFWASEARFWAPLSHCWGPGADSGHPSRILGLPPPPSPSPGTTLGSGPCALPVCAFWASEARLWAPLSHVWGPGADSGHPSRILGLPPPPSPGASLGSGPCALPPSPWPSPRAQIPEPPRLETCWPPSRGASNPRSLGIGGKGGSL